MGWQGQESIEALLVACRSELRQAFATGASEHGSFALEYDVFARDLMRLTLHRLHARSIPPDEATVKEALDKAAGEDVYLACACEHGDARAWSRVMLFQARVNAIIVKRGADHAEASRLVDALWGELAIPPAHDRTRTTVGSFNGSSSLLSWLCGVAVRKWYDLLRARRKLESLPESDELEQASPRPVSDAPPADAPEMVRRALDALASAESRMTDNEMASLVWKHRRSMQQNNIAGLLGVGPPRVVRILQAARKKIQAALREEFGKELDLLVLAEALRRWLEILDASRDPPAVPEPPEPDTR